VLALVGNVDTAFAVINPSQEDILYKFVLNRISGEPRTVISHRNLDNWTALREFLKNSYIEKRTLDYHANHLFKARQGKEEKVTDWIQRLQTLGSQFRDSALLNCSEGAREGVLDLADRLRNISFVQGLVSDHIQTIVRSRNYQKFDEMAETALVEESATASTRERYKGQGFNISKCSFCGKAGHPSSKCYVREKREARVNPVIANPTDSTSNVTCYRCGEKGHFAGNCRKPPKRKENPDQRKPPGNELRRPEYSRPNSIGCSRERRCDYLQLELDVGSRDKLNSLVDIGANISLLKGRNLRGEIEFEPEEKRRGFRDRNRREHSGQNS
jgi:hypothetical protein